MKRINFVFLLLICPFFCFGQYYKQFSTNDGLISNNVYAIKSDSKGYLWFCTDKGVVKYNGQSYEKYTIDNGLTDNDVFNCYEDLLGRVWFYTYNGQYCYYKNGTIYNQTNDSLLKSLPTYSYINAMYHDPDDSALYIGHIYGPIQKIKGFIHGSIKGNWDEHQKIRTIYKQNKELHITTTSQTFEIKNDSLTNSFNKPNCESYNYSHHLLTADSSGVQLYKEGELIWFVEDKDVQISNIYNVYYDGERHVLCGTVNGLFVYDIKSKKKQTFFPNVRVTSSYIDIHKNYWVSTFGKGVYQLYRSNLDSVVQLKNIDSADIIQSNAKQVFIRIGQHFEVLEATNLGVKTTKVKKSFAAEFVPFSYSDSLLFYTKRKNFTSTYFYDLNSSSSKKLDIYFIRAFKVSDSSYLLSTNAQIFFSNYTDGKFSIVADTVFQEEIKSTKYIRQTNTLYFFLKNVFYGYDANTRDVFSIDTLENIKGNNDILFSHNRLLFFNANKLWIYALRDSLHEMKAVELKTSIHKTYKLSEEKFVVNTNDGYGTMYLSKDLEVSSVEPIAYPFEQSDILALYPLGDYLLCNVDNKLYYFPHKIVNKDIAKPRLGFHFVNIGGVKQVLDTTIITVESKANITVSLAPFYFSSDKLSYRYRTVEGDDTSSWNYTNNNEINFSFNSPSVYSMDFQIVSSNRAKSEIKTITINVKPTFFSSPFFYVICIAISILIIVLLFVLYSRQKKKIFSEEMNHMQLENKAVNSLLNPHFIFNAINNIQNLINQNSKEQANEYLAILSVMIRQNMQNLQFGIIPIEKELNLVENYIELQNLRFSDKILYSLNVEEGINPHIPPLLVHTFVENSIVHGFRRQEELSITIEVKKADEDYIIITIVDDGIGLNASRNKAKLSTDRNSLGISYSEKRLKRLSEFYKVNHSLRIEDRYENEGVPGTCVTILHYSKFYELTNNNISRS